MIDWYLEDSLISLISFIIQYNYHLSIYLKDTMGIDDDYLKFAIKLSRKNKIFY